MELTQPSQPLLSILKFGEIDLDVPRDRKSDFEPQIVKKRQKGISGLEEKIISMYTKGMTTRELLL